MSVEYIFSCAVLCRNFGRVMSMIQQGFDVHYRDDYALRRAAEYGDITAVLFLIEHGGNIHARNDSALCWAVQNGHMAIVEILLEKGANISNDIIYYAASGGCVDMLRMFRMRNISLDNDDAICAAVEEGHINALKYLVKHGANIHARNDWPERYARKHKMTSIIEYIDSLNSGSWFSSMYKKIDSVLTIKTP